MDENDEKLLKWLAIQHNRLSDHGDKLWEEMKHFSWVLYILLAAPIIFKFSWRVDGLWLIIFPILAVFAAFIAILIIDKEGNHFLDALGTVLSIEKRLCFHNIDNDENPKILVSSSRESLLPMDEKYPIDKLKENKRFEKFSNRFLFLVYFIVLLIVGIGEIIFLLFYYCKCNGG